MLIQEQVPQARATLDQSRLWSQDSPVEGDKSCVEKLGQCGQVLSREILQISWSSRSKVSSIFNRCIPTFKNERHWSTEGEWGPTKVRFSTHAGFENSWAINWRFKTLMHQYKALGTFSEGVLGGQKKEPVSPRASGQFGRFGHVFTL